MALRRRERDLIWCLAAVAAVAALYLGLLAALGERLLEHSVYDSYTLAALRWREGRIALSHNYPWLELAEYEGRYYVSFPPFPTVPMYLLTFLFGENTPSRLVTFLMFLGVAAVAYAMLRRAGVRPWLSALLAAALPCGCNMMEYGLFGGVWNMAQVMGFLLTLLAFYGVQKGSRLSMGLGLIAIACAVGCRPFQALYVPVLLWLCWRKLREERNPLPALGKLGALCVLPALIAVAYCAYNYVRFGNLFEFGHNYLPEFTNSEKGQFSFSYVMQNLRNVLRLPNFSEKPPFPTAGGFAFWMTNLLYVPFTLGWTLTLVKRKWDTAMTLFVLTAAAHFLLLLLHKSFGGVQFGTRYLCDLLPGLFACLLYIRRERWAPPVWGEYALGGLAGLAIVLNTAGAYLFQAWLKGI